MYQIFNGNRYYSIHSVIGKMQFSYTAVFVGHYALPCADICTRRHGRVDLKLPLCGPTLVVRPTITVAEDEQSTQSGVVLLLACTGSVYFRTIINYF